MADTIDRSHYLESFRQEVEEHLQALTLGLISLESRPDDTSLTSDVFRRIHTIKGSARMMGFGEVADLAHAMEDVLDDLRAGRLRLNAALLDALLTATDLLRSLVSGPTGEAAERSDVHAIVRWLSDLRCPSDTTSAPAALQGLEPKDEGPRLAESAARETVRVDVERVDTILNLAGELAVLDADRRQWSDEILRLAEVSEAIRVAAQRGDRDGIASHAEKLSSALSRAGKLFRRLVNQETEIVRELQYEVSSLRMLPIRAIFSLVPRAARDVARDEGKEVQVVLEGEDTEVDRQVLERVRDPVLHLVRNAVAHGIETPARRLAVGKPRTGRVRVAARSRGGQAIIEVEDDGAGVDLCAVRDAAVRRGIIGRVEADAMPDEECLRLLFIPGFTTRLEVSDTSGRGVGLDVVKAEVESLKGHVSLETMAGGGTKVTLELPITLAFTHVLLIEVGLEVYGLPCAATQGVAEVALSDVQTVQGRSVAPVGGRTVPVVWMHRALGIRETNGRERPRLPAVLLGTPERPVAFVVDRVIGDDNAIVKPLGPLLNRVPNLSGGIILGNGRVALLLSPSGLVEAAKGMAGAAVARSDGRLRRRDKWVLVVDDAVLTRELERGILESAGYRVVTAVDGRDALEKVKSHPFALVVADVEMPRMDGFELAAAIRSDPSLARLPIVIVTSRESDADRRRGLELGVQAYVGKGSFDQLTLLDTIEALIG